jgi:hypothetical protein
MFEGKILQSDLEGAIDGAAGGDGLRTLNWSELYARLGAARDFRRIVGNGAGDGAASFNHSSARNLALIFSGVGY